MSLYTRRLLVNRFNLTVSLLTMLFGLFWLGWILVTLFDAGFGGLSPKLFLQMTPPPGSDGGLWNAIMGSLLMDAAGTLLGTPIGIMAGIYLAEFGSRGWLAPATRVVIRTTENMLRLVPDSLREAAAALGAPQWKVIALVTVRAAKAGIITGILLAVARISGETAPLLFTALNNQFWTSNMNSPMANLPVVIFQFAMSPYEDWHKLAWAGALLITLGVLLLNILARVFFRNRAATY